MIDQTKLVHDTLSLHSDFRVVGIDHNDVLLFSWKAVTAAKAKQALEQLAGQSVPSEHRIAAIAELQGCSWIALSS